MDLSIQDTSTTRQLAYTWDSEYKIHKTNIWVAPNAELKEYGYFLELVGRRVYIACRTQENNKVSILMMFTRCILTILGLRPIGIDGYE